MSTHRGASYLSSGTASSVRIGNHHFAYHTVQIMACRDELPQRPSRRRQPVELTNAHAIDLVGAPEIREVSLQLVHDCRVDRLIDARTNLNVAGVESKLPRVGRRDYHVATDKFAP